jgi:hypothetical protein
LDALLSPIALYPDPLIAVILPASTVPWDISSASAYLVQYGDMSQIDSQPWDPSVRALAHYPVVLNWLADNLAWTQALGSAFSASPAAVMEAIQRLRARAAAAGTLVSTTQQQVLTEDGEIEVVPADAASIYVPLYDPDVVYSVEPYYGYGGPYVTFGPPFIAGIWLSYSFDWRSHTVWAGGNRPGAWHEVHGGANLPPGGAHPWHPPASSRGGPAAPDLQHMPVVPRPRPMPGAPRPPAPRLNGPVAPPSRAAGNSAAVEPPGSPPPMDRPRLNGPPTPATSVQPAAREAFPDPAYQSHGAAPHDAAPASGPPPPSREPPESRGKPEKAAEPAKERAYQAPAPAPASSQAPTPDQKGR